MLQQSAAATGLHLHRERAAHVEVDTVPPLPLQCVAEARELVAASSYHLRHRRHAGVALGVGVAEVFLSHLAMLHPHKRRIILIHPADALVVRPTVDGVGVALERGKGNVHIIHFMFAKIHLFFGMGKNILPCRGKCVILQPVFEGQNLKAES